MPAYAVPKQARAGLETLPTLLFAASCCYLEGRCSLSYFGGLAVWTGLGVAGVPWLVP